MYILYNYRILSFVLVFEFVILSTSNPRLYNSTTIINVSQNKFSIQRYTTGNIKKLSNTTLVRKDFTTTSSRWKSHTKWQIGRVTSKQYEIINLLWQKTKIFIDLDYPNYTCKATTTETAPEFDSLTPTQAHTKQISFKSSILFSKLLTSTPSYIEFYYLDSDDDKTKHKTDFFSNKLKNQNQLNSNIFIWRKSLVPSLLKIRMNTIPRLSLLTEFEQLKSLHKIGYGNFKPNKTETIISFTKNPSTIHTNSKFSRNIQSNKKAIKNSHGSTFANVITKRNVNESFGRINNSSRNVYPLNLYINGPKNNTTTLTTFYDKVKFFEMYDSNTIESQKDINNKESTIIYDTDTELSDFRDTGKILLRHVNEDTGQRHDNNKTRYVKKHIQNFIGKDEKAKNEMDDLTYFSKHDLKMSTLTQEGILFQKHSNKSRLAAWSEFPFVAVYIYEPLQVRCDAASISPHWLLAAASCLSRHRRELHGGTLSAFVTFCSDNWRQPHSMSYVKRTVMHPRYHPRDRVRRHLYNAGVVQIVNSMMDTCRGWTPVALMSHQFTTGQEGSLATAVGWGLDRYVKLSTATEIPNHSLMTYVSLVYSDSCPGSLEYSNAKSLDEDGIRNLFCISLPPYIAEENDTIHGALLLIGGKLLALYLQEERRLRGPQSAHYTGVWRLVPWLLNTAREPDDLYTFKYDDN